jgi:hypothetical protein
MRIKLELGLLISLLIIVSYSLSQTFMLSLPGMVVDFPIHFEWRGDYLYASIVADPQPLIVVVSNVYYNGSVITGGSGYGKGFDQLPVPLHSWRYDEGQITYISDKYCTLTFFGEEVQLSVGEMWTHQGVRIERLSQFEGDYRFQYASTIEYCGWTNHIAYQSGEVWRNQTYDHAFPVIAVTVSVVTTLLRPPTLFNNIGIQILTLCLSSIAFVNGPIIVRDILARVLNELAS